MAGGMGPVPITSAELAASVSQHRPRPHRVGVRHPAQPQRSLGQRLQRRPRRRLPSPRVAESIEQDDRERVARKVTAILGNRSRGTATGSTHPSQKGA